MAAFSLVYAALFAIAGTYMPFWPLWLHGHGITPTQIAILSAFSLSLKLVITPLVSAWADRTGKKQELIQYLSLALIFTYCLFYFSDNFWDIFIVTFISFSVWSPIMSLIESVTNIAAKHHKYEYSQIRVWGSVSFMFTVILLGKLIEIWGLNVILFSLIITSFFLALSTFFIPQEPPLPSHPDPSGLRTLFRYKWFLPFLLTTNFIQGSHAAYYTFSALYWKSHHLSDQTIGFLWGISLAVEIAFFMFGHPLLARLGALHVLFLSSIFATFRWIIMGFTLSLPWLILAQMCHAFSFGAAHAAAMLYMSERIPPAHMATAQGIYSALVAGVGIGAFILISGPLFDSFQGGVFYAMSGLAVAGGLCCIYILRTQSLPTSHT